MSQIKMLSAHSYYTILCVMLMVNIQMDRQIYLQKETYLYWFY